MSYINNQYILVNDDTGLFHEFPEIVEGFQFKVLEMDEDDPTGIVRILDVNTGAVLDIRKDSGSRYWAFFVMNSDTDSDEEELIRRALPHEEIHCEPNQVQRVAHIKNALINSRSSVHADALVYINELETQLAAK
ncbi:inhibitor of host Lon protease [Erwinia phage Cronus]|uniref:Inhibitor of host Lon protease n=1 Tax=Erwinia phage Cronus TaxID=2163633 RepID=A0A2S1GMA0_9CAUD|nr:inhibitor of host Lon protease [Erwinia phage Cronus]AWD90506.1 hypothetical protein [Erwinia phage Cronus]